MLNHDQVQARLTGVFRDTFENDDLTIDPSTTAADIDEWDSLAHITLILAVEREFKIKFKAAEVGGFANVGELMQLIMQRATG